MRILMPEWILKIVNNYPPQQPFLTDRRILHAPLLECFAFNELMKRLTKDMVNPVYHFSGRRRTDSFRLW